MPDLNHRISRLEDRGRLPPPPDAVPAMVTVHGGIPRALQAEALPLRVMLPARAGEALESFRERALVWAGELGADVVVVSGQALDA